ncbi:MAG: APC family permease [Actinomycetota bacterium]|nr:APC family permease [Actinomycetota bacterium]
MERDVDLGTGYAFKRLLLGRPLATSRLEHERLGRPTALAVFSSDNMSSVAYATEEILRVLIPAIGILAFTYVLPISFVIVLIEAILIFSYRQTIKAYPTAGGAYIVTKDNLGLLPAQLAGVALLVDYVLTVSVSTAAGVQAISSVVPLGVPLRIVFSLVFVWMIAYGNLLGVRESGKIFAAPTYLFIVSLGLTCVMGIYEVLSGHLQAFPIQQQVANGAVSPFAGAVTVFILLRAFASGGAAVTGVEAISNGVPAFRKPEWRNAQITLVWMGLILGSSFLAVSFLAARLQVVPVADESKSVLAIIAQAVYGTGALGRLLFLVLQIGTTLILILAANTSFADFPRLASFHAGDAFMPRQLTKRGHRLVFSNGIVALAAAASVVIVVFRASVTAMIPLYALGVFTSFTLSQSGMAKRHLRLREKGWKFGLFVNGLGAIATLVVAIVIAIVKFAGGAWIVMVFVPILVAILVRVNKTYEGEDEQLVIGPKDRANGATLRTEHTALVLVDELDDDTFHAAQYALTIRPTHITALHLGGRDPELEAAWKDAGLRIPLVSIPGDERPGLAIARYLRGLDVTHQQVTVIVPTPADEPFLARLRRMHAWSGLAESLRDLPNVGVVIVRAHGAAADPAHHDRLQLSPRRRHVALILVEDLDQAVLKASRYARGIEALEVRAVHAASDPDRAKMLIDQWIAFGYLAGIPLDVEECNDRNIERSLRRYVSRFQDEATEVTLILPRRHFPKRRHLLLHDRTSRRIASAFAEEPHVDVVVVPFHLGADREHRIDDLEPAAAHP